MSNLFLCGGFGEYKHVATLKTSSDSYKSTRECLVVASAYGSSGGNALGYCTPTVEGGSATLVDDHNMYTTGFSDRVCGTAIYSCKPTNGVMTISFKSSPQVAMILAKG